MFTTSVTTEGLAGKIKNPTQKLFAKQDVYFRQRNTESSSWDIVVDDPDNIQIIINEIEKYKTLGLGNTYVRGLWSAHDLAELFKRIFESKAGFKGALFEIPNSFALGIDILSQKQLNLPLTRQFQVAREHYDLPVELFTGFLGSSMKYSTGEWNGLEYSVDNLDAAQNQNLDNWIRDLDIKDGDVILDPGCGWGSFPLRLAARGLDVTYVGFTISEVQIDHLTETFSDYPKFHFLNQSFHESYVNCLRQIGIHKIDKAICLESIEHSGNKNLPNVFTNIREVMSDKGILGVQIISADHEEMIADPYIGKYIFHHLQIPTIKVIGECMEKNRQFRCQSIINIADSYPFTLKAWHDIFNQNWKQIEPFIENIISKTHFQNTKEWKRHWNLYLKLCEGAYRAKTYPQLYKVIAHVNV